jgi:hypothetical protein
VTTDAATGRDEPGSAADTDVRLSYVVVTDTWDTITGLVASLEEQSAAATIELVVVAPASMGPGTAPQLGRLTHCAEDGTGRAAGVRAAAGDIVALGETHVTHGPEWARTVVSLVDGGADVVLPLMTSANGGLLSEPAFVMDYGRYAGTGASMVDIPPYNAVFRRELLLSLPSLPDLLRPGSALDATLRRRGARVVQVGTLEAATAHLNVSRPAAWAHERIVSGILIAANRSRDWGIPRRGAYALAAPAIAAVLVRRKASAFGHAPRLSGLATLALGCILEAAGEAVGYVGLARPRHGDAMARYETHKQAYVARA